MHTFRPSRGRVLFEVLCALGIAACFAGGWNQTGASAFLPAAAVAALYGLVRAFDLGGRRSAAIAADDQLELKAASEEQLEFADAVEVAELVKPEAPPERKARKTKTPRKPRARRTAEERTEPALPRTEESLADVPEQEATTVVEFPEHDAAHVPLVPLFEPEPFVRQQQRTLFGRKAG
jgi:hypothetical protein